MGVAQGVVLRPLWAGATMMLACRCGSRFEDVTALLRHSRIDHGVTTHWRPLRETGAAVKPRKILTAEARDIVAYARREVQL